MITAFCRRIVNLLAALLLVMTVSCTVAVGQDELEYERDIHMFAFLHAPPQEPRGFGRLLQRAPIFEQQRLGTRPMVVWYHWANERKPFVPSLLFMLFFSITLTSLAPRWAANAQVECKARFWRMFLFGCLILAVAITAIRICLLTMLAWPAAIVLMGAIQIAVIGGLSVMTLSIGESIGSHLRADKWIARADVRRLFCLLIGSLICALLLQIPGFGPLPRIGTRLVGLLAVVGLGALFRSRGREASS